MFCLKIAVAVLVLWGELSECWGARKINSRTDAMVYLKKYGHMDKRANVNLLTFGEGRDAIMSFQKMFGMKQTGLLDSSTMKMMNTPRCGMPDIPSNDQKYAEPRWPKKNLTYAITKYPASTLTKQQVDKEIARAFKVWSDYTDLTFHPQVSRLDKRVDIDIRFEVGSHGDIGELNAFDGPEGTLAHAFFPRNGKAHFDDSEPWTVGSSKGVNLFQIAAHEFGHNLGLNHSEYFHALMYPMYMNYQPNFKLFKDDIEQVQALYGKKTRTGRVFIQKTPPASCDFPEFDTIFTDLKGDTYIFKGTQYWKAGSVGVPRQLKVKWPGLPARIDAAFSHGDLGKTYFFSGAYFWRYQGEVLDDGYPKRIAERFPGIPDNLDAAFVWPRNNQMYFFKGNDYWKFDWTMKPQVSRSYPRNINAVWRGVPESLDAAFIKDGKTYFVKDGDYFVFDDLAITVKSHGVIGRLLGCQGGPVTPSMPKPLKIPRPLSSTKVVESMAKPRKCTSKIRCWKP